MGNADSSLGQRPLLQVADSDGLSIICPDSLVAFSGDRDPGLTWTCPSCEKVLASGLHEHHLIDIGIRCPGCMTIGLTPPRRPGQPLPGPMVMIPPGQCRIDGAIVVTRPFPIVSKRTVDAYTVETGAVWGAQPSRDSLTVDGPTLRLLADELTALLGDRYQAIAAADERGNRSPTPPQRRHRLLVLIEYARDLAEVLEGPDDHPVVQGGDLAELFSTVILLRRWRNHPAWSQMVGALVDGDEVQHTTCLLAMASYLVDHQNGVGIVRDVGKEGRVPDVWIQASLSEQLDLEIKTPQSLRCPPEATQPIDLEATKKEVERLVKKAASTKKGQINPDHGGVVTIGAYSLSPESFAVLRRATIEVLASHHAQGRKAHLVGIAICAHGWAAPVVNGKQTFVPLWRIELLRHPGYTGALNVDDRPRPLPEPPRALPEPGPTQVPVRKVGRNQPCPCGGGKKYKRCHLKV